jgi:hypothetical protein
MPRTTVTEQQIESYQEDGYLIIRDFLTKDELELWREGVLTAAHERGPFSGGGAVVLPTIQGHPTLRGHPSAAADMAQSTTKPDTNDAGVFEQVGL